MAFDLATAKPAGGGFDLKTAKPAENGRDWGDVPLEALSNVPASAGKFLGGIYDAVRHPVDTALNVGNVGYGAIRGAVPDAVGRLMDRADGSASDPRVAAITGNARAQAGAAGQFFKDRYGSAEGLKNALATDPVGIAADASALLSGGAALAGRAGLAGTGAALRAGANATNPLALAGAAARKAAPVAGNTLAHLVGAMGTHTGAESIKGAFQAGRAGGSAAADLADNMRGNVPMTDVLDRARANVQEMGRQKSEAYRAGMGNVRNDRSVLDFTGIDNAVMTARKDVRFGDEIKNVKGADIQQKISDEIANWKGLDPAKYHTPEGLDALKQKVGDIVDSIPFEEKSALRVGTQMYNAIKSEIVKQAPSYAETMKQYSEATEQIREIERALSLGKKAAVDTSLRKLQSLTRNNANTNYGYRLGLARELEDAGGKSLMPALSGQALSSWTPRGIGGALGGGFGAGAYLAGGPVAAVGTLAVQSPRLMGEAALAAGKGARVASDAAGVPLNALARFGLDGPNLANFLYQSDQLNQKK